MGGFNVFLFLKASFLPVLEMDTVKPVRSRFFYNRGAQMYWDANTCGM